MGIYNKFMLYLWLTLAILSTILITIMGIREGFNRWAMYYVFSAVGFMMFFVRRWMMNRMVKHMAFLEQQHNENKGA